MTIKVTENGDKTFTIEWDENDPKESILNGWTEQDFINAIKDYLQTFKEPGEADYYDRKIGESIEYIKEELESIKDEINKNEERMPRVFFWFEFVPLCKHISLSVGR